MNHLQECRLRLVEAETDKRPRLCGYGTVFGVRSSLKGDLIPYTHVIAQHAFDGTLALPDELDVEILVEHNTNDVLARRSDGRTIIIAEPRGLWVEFDAPDNALGRSIVDDVRGGRVTGMSVGFGVLRSQWVNASTGLELIVTEARLREISVVRFPKQPAFRQTVMSLRN